MKKQPSIDFKERTHEYFLKNEKILSVTNVLPGIPEHLLTDQRFIEKTFIGKRVHEHIEKINRSYAAFDIITMPDDILESDLGYVLAWVKFLKKERPKFFAIEEKLFHSRFKYAGTLDVGAIVRRFVHIIDIKTSTEIAPYARLQTVAYMKAWNYNHSDVQVFRRMIVHLKPDKSYKIITYPIKDNNVDFDFFLCKLKSAQWDMQYMKNNNF